MTAAILCPAPSLNDTWRGRGEVDLVIGVNRGATKVPCDVWGAGDHPLVLKERGNVLGSPTLFTTSTAAAYLRDTGQPWGGPVVEFEDLYDYLHPANLSWTLLTLPAAIVYAASRGATSILIYGCDWAGELDFDGAKAGGNRSPERWVLERQIVTRLIDVLKGRGVDVQRVLA